MVSPCENCARVKNPHNCENKQCKDWQAWFIDCWEAMRDAVRKEMEASPVTVVGIPIGPGYYAPPHRLWDSWDEEPCVRCPAPKGLCRSGCAARIAWLEKRSGVER